MQASAVGYRVLLSAPIGSRHVFPTLSGEALAKALRSVIPTGLPTTLMQQGLEFPEPIRLSSALCERRHAGQGDCV